MAYVNAAKAKPCGDCGGVFHHTAMDFDHVDSSTKKYDVSRLAHSRVSIAMISAEIAKCELVCANCHRVRTWSRQRSAMSSL